jgi:hypothetical protein
MVFSLDVRRARKGDCLLLHFGTAAKPGLVVIDGGPSAVYAPHLKPRLVEIRKARGLDAHSPLPVDLLMISHVDDDHMQGILDLTRELRETSGAPLVGIRCLWHNSFDDIIGNDPQELTASVAAQFGAASLAGGGVALPGDAGLGLNGAAGDRDSEVAMSTIKVLASIAQGHRLRLDAEALNIPLNPQFDGKLILAAKGQVALAQGLTFTVAGPMQPELKALQAKHDEWLADLKEKGLTPEEALAAYVDQSVPNLSSVVVLAKAGGKTILLTGDARGDRILQGLELTGALKKNGKMHVDVLKVPHHGSSNNLERRFFERITADHYVFSGDGEHGNPEREAIEMLFAARGKARFAVHLTYPVAEIDAGRKEDWQQAQAGERAANEKRKTAGKPALPVRKNWSPARQGLVAFFKTHPLAKGQKIHIVPPTEPHVIDLLDPLGF